MDLTTLISTPARKLALGLGLGVVLLLILACAWGGYCHGRSTATAEGDAKYSKLETSIAESNRLASEAAKDILDAEIIRRDEAEKSLLAARATIAAQGRAITNRRISDASRSVAPAADGHCVFGPAWVRLWNEALGFGDGDPARAPADPVPAGTAGSGPPPGAGILSGRR